MWLAKQQKRETVQAAGGLGEVTIGGDSPAVELDSERRGLAVYAPGGYRWRPAPGQNVLVLKADGESCVAGTPSAGGISPGEVVVESAGGAAVRLDNLGRVTLTGNVAVTGTLTVGGKELLALIREEAAKAAAEAAEKAMGK